MPVFNWIKINEDSDLKYVLRSNGVVRWYHRYVVSLLWDKIYCEYIDKYAFTDDFIELLEAKMNIALMKVKFMETDDKSITTLIKVEQAKLKELIGEKNKTSYMEMKVYIEKHFGFHLDLKSVTVNEFYTYLEVLKKDGRKSNKA